MGHLAGSGAEVYGSRLPPSHLRRDLYNLYHILNHLNLFGAGYLGQAQNMIDRLELWGQYA